VAGAGSLLHRKGSRSASYRRAQVRSNDKDKRNLLEEVNQPRSSITDVDNDAT